MKFRTAFVSNSSTSSFCILGVFIESMSRGPKSKFTEYLSDNDSYGNTDFGDLETHSPEGCDGTYIGIPMAKFEKYPDLTYRQFEQKAKDQFAALLVKAELTADEIDKITKNLKWGVLEEAYYN